MSACPQLETPEGKLLLGLARMLALNSGIDITGDDDSKKRKHTVDKPFHKKQAKKESKKESKKQAKEAEEIEETTEKRNRSAYAFYFQDQRSKVKEALQAASDGQAPSTTEVTTKVAENWQVLKANAEKGNDAAIKKLTEYAKKAADDKTRYSKSKRSSEEPSEEPEKKKVKMDKTPAVSPEGWKPGDKGKAPAWYLKGIKTGDWRPGNKGAAPLWFQAGMRGMSIDEIKAAKKASKEADDADEEE